MNYNYNIMSPLYTRNICPFESYIFLWCLPSCGLFSYKICSLISFPIIEHSIVLSVFINRSLSGLAS